MIQLHHVIKCFFSFDNFLYFFYRNQFTSILSTLSKIFNLDLESLSDTKLQIVIHGIVTGTLFTIHTRPYSKTLLYFKQQLCVIFNFKPTSIKFKITKSLRKVKSWMQGLGYRETENLLMVS